MHNRMIGEMLTLEIKKHYQQTGILLLNLRYDQQEHLKEKEKGIRSC